MREWLTAALVGTGQRNAPASVSPPVDALVGQLDGLSAERRLLLQVGTLSILQRASAGPAGVGIATANKGESAMTLPPPAPPDEAPALDRPLELALRAVLRGDHEELLEEICGQAVRKGQRLPEELLPAVLSADEQTRRVLEPLLGMRGRWLRAHPGRLARANDAWTIELRAWSRERAQEAWQDGTRNEREHALRWMLSRDRTQAITWIRETWKQDKVDDRARWLRQLVAGLSIDDEALLEDALDDRGRAVRAEAAALLSRLPSSKLIQRVWARAQTFLRFTQSEGALSLTVELPKSFEPSWERDGIVEKPPAKIGKRAFWLRQHLELVPPSHWLHEVNDPLAVVRAAVATDERELIVDAWTRSARTYAAGSERWFEPLFDAQVALGGDELRDEDAIVALYGLLSDESARARLEVVLREGGPLVDVLEPLVTARPGGFAAALSIRAAEHVKGALLRYEEEGSQPWIGAGAAIAARLHPDAFDRALTPIELADDGNRRMLSRARQALDMFEETVRFRQSYLTEDQTADQRGRQETNNE